MRFPVSIEGAPSLETEVRECSRCGWCERWGSVVGGAVRAVRARVDPAEGDRRACGCLPKRRRNGGQAHVRRGCTACSASSCRMVVVGRRRTSSDAVARRGTPRVAVGRRRTPWDAVGRRRSPSDSVGAGRPGDASGLASTLRSALTEHAVVSRNDVRTGAKHMFGEATRHARRAHAAWSARSCRMVVVGCRRTPPDAVARRETPPVAVGHRWGPAGPATFPSSCRPCGQRSPSMRLSPETTSEREPSTCSAGAGSPRGGRVAGGVSGAASTRGGRPRRAPRHGRRRRRGRPAAGRRRRGARVRGAARPGPARRAGCARS